MKAIFLIGFFSLFTLSLNAQNSNNTMFLNGWEFLEWDMKSETVEKLLRSNGVDYTPLTPQAKLRATQAKNYKGFEQLAFMYDGGLVQVQQYHRTKNRTEAGRFVEKLRAELEKAYGMAILEETTDEQHRWQWVIGHTQIGLYFYYPADGTEYETQLFYEKTE